MFHFVWLWVLVNVLGRLPRRVVYATADAMSALMWLSSSSIRRVTDDHMRHVLGAGSTAKQRRRAGYGCVRSVGRYYADFCIGPRLKPGEVFDHIEVVDGLAHLFEASDRGCGVIAISAHLGNPEYVIRAAARMGLNPLAFTEPLSPPRVNEFVHRARATPGARFVPVGLSAVREAVTHLRGGGLLTVLADRDVLANGHATVFFGERASLPTGTVELALRTGAAIVPIFVVRTPDDRYGIHIEPALALAHTGDRAADLEAGMQRVAAALEAGIRRAPDQWYPLRPIWSGLAR